jgi:putative ABC transport system ATP-binding protein
MNSAYLSIQHVSKFYDARKVHALNDVSFDVMKGEVVAIIGPSGCGKSSLLSLMGLLDRPDEGRIVVGSRNLTDIPDPYSYRANTVGFVFQFHHLLPAMTLYENIEAPLLPLGMGRAERQQRVATMLENMNLLHRATFFPAEVSGGERQRAAVARAMINEPELLLADEPTGNLDSSSGAIVMDAFLRQARDRQMTVLLVTHNQEIAARADRIVTMQDGKISCLIQPEPNRY